MAKTETYTHHGALVAVQSDLKGKHRAHCLCYRCVAFTADRSDGAAVAANCPIANMVYALCVLQDLVLPVWECPQFVARD